MKSSAKKNNSSPKTTLPVLSDTQQYLDLIEKSFNCILDENVKDVFLTTDNSLNLQALYQRCQRLRLFSAMHQLPQHWMPTLTMVRLIMMTGQQQYLADYCSALHITLTDIIEQDPQLLHFAAIGGNPEIIKAVIHAGIDADTQDVNGITPVMLAAVYGHNDCVAELMQHQINIHHRDNMGRNVYHCAAFAADATLMTQLQQLGLDPETSDDFTTTTSHYIAWGGNANGSHLYEQARDPNNPGPVTRDGISLWHAQLIGGLITSSNGKIIEDNRYLDDQELCSWLAIPISSLAYRILDREDFFDHYPFKNLMLLQAAKFNNFEIYVATVKSLKLFWSFGLKEPQQCALYADAETGNTPIHYFALSHGLRGLQYCYESLTDKSLFFTTIDKTGNNVIHCAAQGGDCETMRWCLAQSSDPRALMHATNNNNETVLHRAALSNNPEMIALCVEYGLQTQKADTQGLTPVDHALAKSTLPVILALLDAGAEISNVDTIVSNPHPSAIHFVLRQSEQLPMSESRYTHLHQAMSQANNTSGLRYLEKIYHTEQSIKYFKKVLSSSPSVLIDHVQLRTLLDTVETSLYQSSESPPPWAGQCDQLLNALPALSGSRFKFSSGARQDTKIETLKGHLEQLKLATSLNIFLKTNRMAKGHSHNIEIL